MSFSFMAASTLHKISFKDRVLILKISLQIIAF